MQKRNVFVSTLAGTLREQFNGLKHKAATKNLRFHAAYVRANVYPDPATPHMVRYNLVRQFF
jgi:hypothetical protein